MKLAYLTPLLKSNKKTIASLAFRYFLGLTFQSLFLPT